MMLYVGAAALAMMICLTPATALFVILIIFLATFAAEYALGRRKRDG